MKNLALALLLLTLILGACSTNLPSTESFDSTTESVPVDSPTELTPALPIPKFISTVSTPHIDQPADVDRLTTPIYSGNCAYQWAYKDLLELTTQLDASIKSIDPNAKAWATAFGEDCVYADGHADFSAIETDFYIHQPAADLTDFESFGNWLAQGLTIIEALPSDLAVGSQTGFVEFWFIKNDAEHLIVRIPIQKYRDQAAGKSGEELFRLFYTNP